MFFNDIIGQHETKKRLISSIQAGLVPHAQLFCGPEGVGKLPLAIAYAQYLNCESPSADDSCGYCSSCRKYKQLVHPDLHFVFPMHQVTKLKKRVCDDYISEWRSFVEQSSYFNLAQWLHYIQVENAQGAIYSEESGEILRKLSLRIYEAKYKVMLIWLPEKMNEACANKLLKIIEEPYDNTVFLLVSDAPSDIITTIQSRCQRINIGGVEKADIEQALVVGHGIGSAEAVDVAHLSKGSYLKALQTISLNEETKLFATLFVQMMRASYMRNIKEIKKIANELAALGRERQKSFLAYCQRMIREYFVANLNRPEMVYLSQEELNFGQKFAPFINERNIEDLMDELSLADLHIERNVNAKMVFFDLCLQITLLIKR